MSSIIRVLTVAIVALQLASCNPNTELKRDVERLYSMRIEVPYNKMHEISNENDSILFSGFISPYKMILYVDSTECSPCQMKSMFQWNDLLYLEKEQKMDFTFIFQPKDFVVKEMEGDLLSSGLKHRIFVDTCGAFQNSNKGMPDNVMLHCFLVNDKDSVVLVGDPTRNTKIRQMLLELVDRKAE